ncbi:MAG: Zn-dependent exopeptidase M28 [Candidatus Heimdallarchaeota archaeon]|nr:Zn-dependent exopeptidase M28 [Candidatus Heimdallarchaeota archaeon]
MTSLMEPIEYICENFGPRITGTEADHKTCDYIEEKFKTYTSNVETETFPVVGRALQNLTLFLVWGYCISVVSYFFLAPLAIVLATLMLLVYYLARFKDKNLVNLLVKKDETKNIIAQFDATEEKKTTLIFSGHHDSAFHMPLFEKNVKQIAFIQNSAIFGIGMLVIASIWKSIYFIPQINPPLFLFSYNLGSLTVSWYIFPDVIFILALIGLVFGFYFLKNMVTKTPVFGANDNLTSVSMLFGLGEYLKKNPPKNVEIRLISFGAEEPGLVGSKFYVDKRVQELENTVNINFETLGSGTLGILLKEKDNNVQHDAAFVSHIQEIGRKHGFDLPSKMIHFGNTDAGSFTKKKIPATTIFCYGEDDVFDLWHSTRDVFENLDGKLLQKAFDLTIKIIEEYDQ